jgi:hypothetical protein
MPSRANISQMPLNAERVATVGARTTASFQGIMSHFFGRWIGGMSMAVLLLGASAALADTATISVTTTAGAADPVAGVPGIVTVSGVASAPARIYVKYRATGGAPCASSSAGDAGTVLGGFYAERVNGAFSLQDVVAWPVPGGVLFCTWLSTGDAETITAPIAQLIAFRAPQGTVAAAVRPARPRPGGQVAIAVTGSAEAPAAVYATVRRAGGAPCARSYAGEPARSLLDGALVDGRFSLALTTTQSKPGGYLVCLWVARSASDPSPIAGPAPVTFTVRAPRCVVPRLGAHRRRAAVRRRIRRAHCRLGRARGADRLARG